MRNRMMVSALAAVALTVGLSACSGTNDAKTDDAKTDTSTSQSQSTAAADARTGEFEGLNGKNVAGKVSVSSGELKLTGFSSDEGPDLHVYLTNGTDEAAVSEGMMITPVAFDQAEQSFSFSGVDVSQYSDVVIHCDKAKAVFGAAKLS